MIRLLIPTQAWHARATDTSTSVSFKARAGGEPQ